jgi:hypothetical protein
MTINCFVLSLLTLLLSRGQVLSKSTDFKDYQQDFHYCSEELRKTYATPFEGKNQKDKEWCTQTMKKYGTVIGKRWFVYYLFILLLIG